MVFSDPFASVHYHWNVFDACMLLPYFAVMILLSFYGIHRYTMCYQYFKYRKNYEDVYKRQCMLSPCFSQGNTRSWSRNRDLRPPRRLTCR